MTDGSGEDTSLDRFADAAFYKAELGKLHRLVQHLDICPYALALVALPVVMFALESGIARLIAVFHTAEEVLKGRVQVLKGCLQRCGIHFLQPRQFPLEHREAFVLLEPRGRCSCFSVLLLPLGEKVVEHIPAATKIPGYLRSLHSGRIQTKLVGIFHYLTSLSDVFLILYVLHFCCFYIS